MMEFYLLRHAIAEDVAPTRRDADRRLTEEGREKLRRVLKRAEAAKVQPSLILSSPLVRAVETAEVAAEVLGYAGKIVKVPTLEPGSSPQAVWEEVRSRRDELSILAVGHEPLFSATLAYLLGSTRTVVNFKKAGLARLDLDRFSVEPAAALQWLITPKVC